MTDVSRRGGKRWWRQESGSEMVWKNDLDRLYRLSSKEFRPKLPILNAMCQNVKRQHGPSTRLVETRASIGNRSPVNSGQLWSAGFARQVKLAISLSTYLTKSMLLLLLYHGRVAWCLLKCFYSHICCLGAITVCNLSLIHIWRCRRSTLCRSRWSPYH